MSGEKTLLPVNRREFLSALLLIAPGIGLGLSPAEPSRGKLAQNLGIITDELTNDFEQALDFISSNSLAFCELRQLWNKNIMNLTRDELDRAKRTLDEHSLRVSVIASPVFKYNLPEMPARAEKRDTFLANFTDQDTEDLLRKSFELAKFFGTTKVRIFSYWRVEEPEKAYPFVRDRLAKAAALASRNQAVLVLENEHTCNIGTGKELGRILRDVNSPQLRGNWDPGNAAMLNEVPYPDGYRHVRELFEHMHVKDVRKDPRTGKLEWAPVGGGLINYRGHLKALHQDRYAGTLSLETHYRRPDGNTVESSRESLAGLLEILKEVE